MKRIAFTGDLGFSSKYFKGTYDKENLLDEEIVSFLSDSDYTVVNVEGSVTAGKAEAVKPIAHANPPECLPFLKKINGNIWALANNHIADCGRKGLSDTLEIAKKNGVLTVGAGLDANEAEAPVIIENDGADIGIISLTHEDTTPKATKDGYGSPMWDDDETVSRMIKNVKEKCRWCIVVVHSGPEFCFLMPPAVRKQYKKYLEFGADIVIGHHPHVVDNYEKIGDKIIFYSIGNFVFDTDYQRLQRHTDCGVLVKFYFDGDKFTWEHIAMKIDRETMTIHKEETPVIFTNISAGQYSLLWPLAMRHLYLDERAKWEYIYPGYKDYSLLKRFLFYRKHGKVSARNTGIISGTIMYYLNLWRLGDKKLIDYIRN